MPGLIQQYVKRFCSPLPSFSLSFPASADRDMKTSHDEMATPDMLDVHLTNMMLIVQPCCKATDSNIAAWSSGFDRAYRNLGAAPCQGSHAEGAWPLVLCNAGHYVLENF